MATAGVHKFQKDLASLFDDVNLSDTNFFGPEAKILTKSYVEASRCKDSLRSESFGPDNDTSWCSTVTLNYLKERIGIGTGSDKKKDLSSYIAYGECYNSLPEPEKRKMAKSDYTSILSSAAVYRNLPLTFNFTSNLHMNLPQFRCVAEIKIGNRTFESAATSTKKDSARRLASRYLLEELCNLDYLPYHLPMQALNLQGPDEIFTTVKKYINAPITYIKECWKSLVTNITSWCSYIISDTIKTKITDTFKVIWSHLEPFWLTLKQVSEYAILGAFTGLFIFLLWILGFIRIRSFFNLIDTVASAVGIHIPERTKFWIETQEPALTYIFSNSRWEKARQAFKLWADEPSNEIQTHDVLTTLTRALESHEDVRLIGFLNDFIVDETPDKGRKWSAILTALNNATDSQFNLGTYAVQAREAYSQWCEDSKLSCDNNYKSYLRCEAFPFHGIVPQHADNRKPLPTQGPVGCLPFVVGIFGALMTGSWPTDSLSAVKFVAVSSAFGAFTKGATPILEVITSAIPRTIYYWFNELFYPNWTKDEEYKDTIRTATLLLKFGQSRSDLSTEKYKKDLDACASKMLDIILNDTDKDRRSYIVPFYNRLLAIQSTIVSFDQSHKDRPAPFSLWFTGTSGFGKTTLTKKFLKDAFGHDNDQICTVNGSSKHWDLVGPCKSLIIEEALNTSESDPEVLSHWLGLISTASFSPPKADLPSKGTIISPEIIVSTSNHAYPGFGTCDRESIWRRRDKLIQVSTSDDCPINGEGKPDWAKLPETYRRYFKHLKFRLKHPYQPTNILNGPWMNYIQLVKLMRKNFLAHSDLQIKIMKGNKPNASSYEQCYSDLKLQGPDPTCKICSDPISDKTAHNFTCKVKKGKFYYYSLCPTCVFSSRARAKIVVPHKGSTLTLTEHMNLAINMQDRAAKDPTDIPSSSTSSTTNAQVRTQMPPDTPVPSYAAAVNDNISVSSDPDIETEEETELLVVDSSTPESDNESFESADDDPLGPPIKSPYDTEVQLIKDLYDSSLTTQQEDRSGFLTNVMQFGAIGVGLLALRSALSFIFGKIDDYYIEHPSVDYNSAPKGRKQTRGRRNMANYNLDFNGKDMNRHLVDVTIDGGTPWRALLSEKTLIINAHAVCDVNDKKTWEAKDLDLQINHNTQTYRHKHYKINTWADTQSDLAFLDLTACQTMPSCGKIDSFLLTDSDFDHLPANFYVDILGEARTIKAKLQTVNVKLRSLGVDDSKIETLESAVIYDGVYKSGDCGKRVRIQTGRHAGKLLGFHSYGNASTIGVCTIVTRDDIESFRTRDLTLQGPDRPNLVEHRSIGRFEQVFNPTHTKITRSKIDAPWQPTKAPAPLAQGDPILTEDIDPGTYTVETLFQTNPNREIDQELLDKAGAELKSHLAKNLIWPLPPRNLTTDEAILGVPGVLPGVDMNTSAGYPLLKNARKRGKHSFIEHYFVEEKGELITRCRLRPALEAELKRWDDFVNDGDERTLDARFLIYLKDELRPLEKAKKGATRIIFACPLALWIKMRQTSGPLVAAFQYSWARIASSIGCNPTSHDLDTIYKRLIAVTGVDAFFAGDYKGYDKRLNKDFMIEAFRIITELLLENIPDFNVEEFSAYTSMVLDAPIQFRDQLFRLDHGEKSGHPLTGIVNSLVNELYFIYAFKKLCPGHVFHENVAVAFVGDDNIVSVKPHLHDNFNEVTFAEEIAKIGQEYTAADKVSDLSAEFRKFTEIQYLGCQPRLHNGKYLGALKMEILREMVLWRRTGTDTDHQNVLTALRFSAAHGKAVFESFRTALLASTEDKFIIEDSSKMEFDGTITAIAAATANSESQENDIHLWFNAPPQLATAHSYAKLKNPDVVLPSTDLLRKTVPAPSNTMAEPSADLCIGARTSVPRAQFTWKSTDVTGQTLFATSAPWALLELNEAGGSATSIQNMPFEHTVFWRGSISFDITINGLPTQGGALIAYWRPLGGDYIGQNYDFLRYCLGYQHQIILPQKNSLYTLDIPYFHPKRYLSSYGRQEPAQELGELTIRVLAPLTSGNADIVLFSRFEDSEFKMVRPPGTSQFPAVNIDQYPVPRTRGRFTTFRDGAPALDLQGNSSSVYNLTNIGDVGGDVSSESMGRADASQEISPETEVTIPAPSLDSPFVAGGGFPIYVQSAGMSRSTGAVATNSMQLKPNAIRKTQVHTFGSLSDEANISSLCGRESYQDIFTWKSTDPSGTLLFSAPATVAPHTYNGNSIWTSLERISTSFLFWQGDLQYRVSIFANAFQSGRLRAVQSYGAEGAVTFAASSQQPYQELNIGSGQQDHEITIPYVAQTEYLQVPRGIAETDPAHNSSLGYFSLYVDAPLISSSNVAEEVTILVSLRFNGKFAVPSPLTGLAADHIIRFQTPPTPPLVHLQGPDNIAGITESADTSQSISAPAEPTLSVDSSNRKPEAKPIGVTNEGEIFEYPVRSVLDLARRYTPHPHRISGVFTTGGKEYNYRVFEHMCPSVLRGLFIAWKGSLHFRILFKNRTQFQTLYYPTRRLEGSYTNAGSPGLTEDDSAHAITASLMVPNVEGYTTDATKQWSKHTNGINPAQEVPFEHYADLNVPFQSHLDFEVNHEIDGYGFRAGLLYVVWRGATHENPDVFSCAGDDFQVAGYNVARRMGFYTAPNAVPGNDNVNYTRTHCGTTTYASIGATSYYSQSC